MMVFTWLLPGCDCSYFSNTVRKQEQKGNNSKLQQSYQQSSVLTKKESEESAKREGKGRKLDDLLWKNKGKKHGRERKVLKEKKGWIDEKKENWDNTWKQLMLMNWPEGPCSCDANVTLAVQIFSLGSVLWPKGKRDNATQQYILPVNPSEMVPLPFSCSFPLQTVRRGKGEPLRALVHTTEGWLHKRQQAYKAKGR